MLRRHGQRRIHDFIRQKTAEGCSAEPIIVNAHRRLGKSFLPVLLGIETCLKKPHQHVIFGAPTYDQVRQIVVPLLDQVLSTAPDDLRPKSRGYQWTFKNPWFWEEQGHSTFSIVGVNWRRGDRLRGTFADRIFLDEVRDVEELRYIYEEVLLPQFVGREEPLLVMMTTPPRNLDHDWATHFLPQSISSGRYICVRGSENADFEERDRKMILKALGGDETSTAWQREVECQLVADRKDLITPEFLDHESEIVCETYDRPKWLVPYTCMDTGYDPDYTGIVFGYVDFLRGYLVVEDEHFEKRMTLGDINKVVRSKEVALWGKSPYHDIRRVADLDERGLADLLRGFKLFFRPVEKYNAEAALGKFRTRLQNSQVRILSRCKNCIYQLKYGIWNKNETDFERSEQIGHWDCGKALVYLNRMVNWRENPIPAAAVDHEHQFQPFPREHEDDILLRAFGRK